MALTPEQTAELAEIRGMIELLEQRSSEMLGGEDQQDADLSGFIDASLSSRIQETEERLRAEFQDEQSQTLDVFLKMLDQKVLPRIAKLEAAIGMQPAGSAVNHANSQVKEIHQKAVA